MKIKVLNTFFFTKTFFIKLAKEPLIHFIGIGCIIFAIDQSAQPGNENVIKLSGDIQNELVMQFEKRMARLPTPEERRVIFEKWTSEELLFREGIKLNLGQNDPAIRERIIQKMQFLMENRDTVADASQDTLLTWFNENKMQYRAPSRYDIEYFTYSHNDANSKVRANEHLQQLADSNGITHLTQASRLIVDKSESVLRAIYGEEFTRSIAEIGINNWSIIEGRKGWHVLRILALHEAELPTFDNVKDRVNADWQRENQRLAMENSLIALRQQYKIQVDTL